MTPIWVPLVSAAIGALFGALSALGGQILTTKREEKRWDREKEQNETRMLREDQYRNHADRKAAYEKILTAHTEWQVALFKAAKDGQSEISSFDDLDKRVEDFVRARAAMRIIAPFPVRKAWKAAAAEMAELGKKVRSGTPITSKEIGVISRSAEAAMRIDLGVEDDEIGDEVPNEITAFATAEQPQAIDSK